MNVDAGITLPSKIPFLFTFAIIASLAGCDNQDEEDNDGIGYIQLYNGSANAPAIVLSVDQKDDDDFIEINHSSVDFQKASKYLFYDNDTYDINLSWQDGNDADDLESIYESQLVVTTDLIKFIVVAEDIVTPNILTFDIPFIDDEDDEDDQLFNARFLNMHPDEQGIDVYLSKADESFNEATLIEQLDYTELSNNHKVEDDDYVFYITSTGNEEILYQSDEVDYTIASQYVMVVRENNGVGTSPYTLDRVTNSTTVKEFSDVDAETQFRVYNGIQQHELLSSYQGVFDLKVDSGNQIIDFPSINHRQFSESYFTDFGDYKLSLSIPTINESLIEDHLLSLEADSDKTVFFYLLEEEVDEDGDGDVDEDGDGFVDQIEVTVNSMVVENSREENIYYHQVKVINLIDDYDSLEVYFVKNNETITTADNSIAAPYTSSRSISLLNNTYAVHVVASEDNNQLVLASSELVLDEDSQDLFLIVEETDDAATEYSLMFSHQ